MLGVDKVQEVLCSLRGDFWFGWDGLRRLVGWLVGWLAWKDVGAFACLEIVSVICHHG